MNVLQCMVCNLSCGNCFRCSEVGCDAWFHISCGIFAGFRFQIDRQNSHRIIIQCLNHIYILDKVSLTSSFLYNLFNYINVNTSFLTYFSNENFEKTKLYGHVRIIGLFNVKL